MPMPAEKAMNLLSQMQNLSQRSPNDVIVKSQPIAAYNENNNPSTLRRETSLSIRKQEKPQQAPAATIPNSVTSMRNSHRNWTLRENSHDLKQSDRPDQVINEMRGSKEAQAIQE